MWGAGRLTAVECSLRGAGALIIDAIRTEYRRIGIGPEMLHALRRLCRQAAGRYPPEVYASASRWDDDAVDDLVQELITTRLLDEKENQLVYIMDVAATTQDFERLVIYQARRVLTGRVQRTVVDNLLHRCVKVLAGDEFERRGSEPERHRLTGSQAEIRDPTPAEIRSAAVAARAVPRMSATPNESRLPVLYTAERVRKLVLIVAHTLQCAFSERDLRRILELLLAEWLPPDLDPSAETDWVSDGSDLDGEARLAVEAAVVEARAILSDEQRAIVHMTMLGTSDGQAAEALGISRPTLAKRKGEALSLLGGIVDDMDDASRRAYVCLLGEALMDEELERGR